MKAIRVDGELGTSALAAQLAAEAGLERLETHQAGRPQYQGLVEKHIDGLEVLAVKQLAEACMLEEKASMLGFSVKHAADVLNNTVAEGHSATPHEQLYDTDRTLKSDLTLRTE